MILDARIDTAHRMRLSRVIAFALSILVGQVHWDADVIDKRSVSV